MLHMSDTTPDIAWDLIQLHIQDWPQAQDGPAATVLVYEHLDDRSIRDCLDLIAACLRDQEPTDRERAFLEEQEWYGDHEPEELRATRDLLNELLEMPYKERVP